MNLRSIIGTISFQLTSFLLILTLPVKSSLVDIPWSVGTSYIKSSLEAAQKHIENSRVSTLEQFVKDNCESSVYYQYEDPEYKKEMWNSFESWYSDASVLAGMIFENAIISDSNKTYVDIKPLISKYLDTLIWREIVSCVIFGVSISLFIIVTLGFVLCRILNDRVISFEETSQGLWKVKLSLYILVISLCALCFAYVIVSIFTITNFINFFKSFSSSVCWIAVGAEALSNGNININTTSGSFNITESSLRTNTTIPFIGSLPLHGLFQELGSVEAINGLIYSTFDYIDGVGFSTTLSKRLNEFVEVFTNQTLMNPTDTNWYIPSQEKLSNPVIEASKSFLLVNETLYKSVIPKLSKIISLAKSVDISSMSYSVSAYFEVFQHFIGYILIFLNISKIGSKSIFGIITSLCACAVFVGIITIIFSILHIKLFLSGRNHLGFFQSRSAMVAVAFIILGFSTVFSFITYSLMVAGTVGKDYCAWIVKDMFSPIGMSWVSTVRPEIGMIMNICMYPLASYIKKKKTADNRELINEQFLLDRIRILEKMGIVNNTYLNHYNYLEDKYFSEKENMKDEFFKEFNQKDQSSIIDKSNNSVNNKHFLSELDLDSTFIKTGLLQKGTDYSDLVLSNNRLSSTTDNSKDSILLAEQYGDREIVNLLTDAPINSSISVLLFQLLPGNLVMELTEIVPDFLNLVSTSKTIADQCFNYINITDYIKHSLMYFPDVRKASIDEQTVPVLVLITQSHEKEQWLIKNSVFGYSTYYSLSSSPNENISKLMVSSSLPLKIPGLRVLESIIEPFRIDYLVKEDLLNNDKDNENNVINPVSKAKSTFEVIMGDQISNTNFRVDLNNDLIIKADTDIDKLDVEKYHKTNKYFADYSLSTFKYTLEWAKKSMKLYDYEFYCYPFSWLNIQELELNSSIGNNSLYLKYSGKNCNYSEFIDYITSLSYDYLINPTNNKSEEVERLNIEVTERVRSMLGSAIILNSIRTEAHNCGQVSVDSTNGIVTFCGMVGKTKDTLIVILNIITFIGFTISILIGIIWIISLRYESRVADSILEMEQSSNESVGNVEKETENIDVRINNKDVLNIKVSGN